MNCSDLTLYDLIAGNAARHPDRDAVICGKRRITFWDWRKRCDQYAAGLVREGLSRGDRIAVVAGNEDDFLTLLGAAAKIGAIAVPVNWRLSEEEIAYILQDTQPTLLFAGSEHVDQAGKAAAKVNAILAHPGTPRWANLHFPASSCTFVHVIPANCALPHLHEGFGFRRGDP